MPSILRRREYVVRTTELEWNYYSVKHLTQFNITGSIYQQFPALNDTCRYCPPMRTQELSSISCEVVNIRIKMLTVVLITCLMPKVAYKTRKLDITSSMHSILKVLCKTTSISMSIQYFLILNTCILGLFAYLTHFVWFVP